MNQVRVDPTRCQGYGFCVELATEEFVFDDWGFVQSRGHEVSADRLTHVERAVESCPMRAIRWAQP